MASSNLLTRQLSQATLTESANALILMETRASPRFADATLWRISPCLGLMLSRG